MGVIMADQKIENLLNLAAGSTNSEKEKSENLQFLPELFEESLLKKD